jgi:hypothetical protein
VIGLEVAVDDACAVQDVQEAEQFGGDASRCVKVGAKVVGEGGGGNELECDGEGGIGVGRGEEAGKRGEREAGQEVDFAMECGSSEGFGRELEQHGRVRGRGEPVTGLRGSVAERPGVIPAVEPPIICI